MRKRVAFFLLVALCANFLTTGITFTHACDTPSLATLDVCNASKGHLSQGETPTIINEPSVELIRPSDTTPLAFYDSSTYNRLYASLKDRPPKTAGFLP